MSCKRMQVFSKGRLKQLAVSLILPAGFNIAT